MDRPERKPNHQQRDTKAQPSDIEVGAGDSTWPEGTLQHHSDHHAQTGSEHLEANKGCHIEVETANDECIHVPLSSATAHCYLSVWESSRSPRQSSTCRL